MAVTYTLHPLSSMPGRRTAICINTEIADPATLREYGLRQLARVSRPPVEYDVDVADVSAVRTVSGERAGLGDWADVVDEELGIAVRVRLVEVDRSLDEPSQIRVQFDNRSRDLSDMVADVVAATEDPEQTEWLPGGQVSLDGTDPDMPVGDFSVPGEEGPATAGNWPTRVQLGEVIAVNGTGIDRTYKVLLLSNEDRSDTEEEVDNAVVPDPNAPALTVGDHVAVSLPPPEDTGKPIVLVSGIGGASELTSLPMHSHAGSHDGGWL